MSAPDLTAALAPVAPDVVPTDADYAGLEGRTPWEITDDVAAEWAAHQLRTARDSIARADVDAAERQAQIDAAQRQLDDWYRAQVAEHQRAVEFFAGHLSRWAVALRVAGKLSGATFRTRNGVSISTTDTAPTVEFDAGQDGAAKFLAWLDENGHDVDRFGKVERTPQVSKVRKHIRPLPVDDDGNPDCIPADATAGDLFYDAVSKLVFTGAGDPVPGLTVTDREVKVSGGVKVDD